MASFLENLRELNPNEYRVERFKQGGFTLLEMLVAIGIFAMMSVAAYSGLDGMLKAQAAIDASGEQLAGLQMAMVIIGGDFEQATNRPVRDEYAIEQAAMIGSSTLEFTRSGWDNPLRQARATLQRVRYEVEDGALIRSYWPTLDRGSSENPRRAILIDNIEEASFRFGPVAGEWFSDWPRPAQGEEEAVPLPRAIELNLTIKGVGEITRLFRLPQT